MKTRRPPTRRRAGSSSRSPSPAPCSRAPARADLVSPGELSRAHEKLEGLQNCTKCHVAGKQFSAEKCLECHKELRAGLAAGKGFHGRLSRTSSARPATTSTRGAGFALIDWGDAGQKSLRPREDRVPARRQARQGEVRELPRARGGSPTPAVKEVLAKGRKSMLGAPATCAGCHFDEHRAQVGNDCQKCHDPTGWKPASKGFDHAKTQYPLTGLHAKVECEKCHAPLTDPEGKHDFPQAVSADLREVQAHPLRALHRLPQGPAPEPVRRRSASPATSSRAGRS